MRKTMLFELVHVQFPQRTFWGQPEHGLTLLGGHNCKKRKQHC